MNNPIRLLIHGASGRMGRALRRLAAEDRRLLVVAAVVGRDASGSTTDGGPPVFPASHLPEVPAFDVAIDFSQPEGLLPILELCLERRAALVSGTTGLGDAQRQRLEAAAQMIPVLWAANFSLGVAVLEDLVRRAASALPDWQCDIVEAHHVHKKDAPSGTALTLGQAAQAGGGHAPHYASLRAGDIVGEHTVQFAGMGERIELIHRAGDRDIFARGALEAAVRLSGRKPGLLRFSELLFASPGA